MNVERFYLTSKEDCLRNNWFIWRCQKELLDGTLVNGYVEADGQGMMIAVETFEEAD